eukprot:458817_1
MRLYIAIIVVRMLARNQFMRMYQDHTKIKSNRNGAICRWKISCLYTAFHNGCPVFCDLVGFDVACDLCSITRDFLKGSSPDEQQNHQTHHVPKYFYIFFIILRL